MYAPTLAYLIAMVSAFIVPTIGDFIEKKMRVDDVVGAVAVHGFMGFLALIWLTAFLSINVGLVNLLPIPVLDGGHLMFMAIEVVRRQPLSPHMLKICSLGGLAALVVISVLVTGHDIVRLGFFG